MTFKHQSPFKEGEVSQILQSLRDSEQRRHAEAIAARDAFRVQFGGDWFASEETVGATPEKIDDALAALDRLPTQDGQDEAPASPHTTTRSGANESSAPELGLFAGEPSYPLCYPEPHLEDRKALPLDSLCPQQQTSSQATHAESGVNAKTGRSTHRGRPLSTPGRAGLIAKFHLSRAERVVAIGELHTDLDHDQIQSLLRTADLLQKLAQDYQGTGQLPDWAKFVTPEMKQFFRLYLLCTKPDAKTITIRLDHYSAEAALAALRGPANYLAGIIKRTMAKLGLEAELAFNLEFNHTGSTENHPLHIHGVLCIPDDGVKEVSEALRRALAEDYRQRYTNLAVHIEAPRSVQWWAAYCIKEYDITTIKLTTERGQKSRPDYATQQLTQEAKAFYENISAWLNS